MRLLLLFIICFAPIWNKPGNESIILGDIRIQVQCTSPYYVETLQEDDGPMICFHFPKHVDLIISQNALSLFSYDCILPRQLMVINNDVSVIDGQDNSKKWKHISYLHTNIYFIVEEESEISDCISSFELSRDNKEIIIMKFYP